ncbi:MAG: LLM class flavin-dependent oxidoreductase [Chloroflexi bacterium]|nr:LLM class flavin-dependent oxidoreductase [Chloroflexota bacterium]
MTAPKLGRIGVWGHLDSLSIAEARAYAGRVEELGIGALWVPETVGREPIALLALLAGSTEKLVLGTSIVSIWGRDAQGSRMAARTLAEATGGRFVLGLGVSHPHLAQKLRGHHFDRPLTRMREYLAAYRAAVYRGPGAETVEEPPVMIAALRERMTDLAATEADGALPYLVTAERVAWMRERLDAAASGQRPALAVTLPVVIGAEGDRSAARAYLRPYLRTPTYHASWSLQGFAPEDWAAPASDRLVDAMVAVGSVREVRRRIAQLHDAGADHVAILPLAEDGSTENVGTLGALSYG